VRIDVSDTPVGTESSRTGTIHKLSRQTASDQFRKFGIIEETQQETRKRQKTHTPPSSAKTPMYGTESWPDLAGYHCDTLFRLSGMG